MVSSLSPQSLFTLEGKHALVTGGASGLGRMIAQGLLEAGASVTLTSRKPDSASAAAKDLSALGDCDWISADLADIEALSAISSTIGERRGRLDILVNNAGRTWGGALEEFPDKAWTDVLAVNVRAPFKLIQTLLPLLGEAASAEEPTRIINLGSVAGKVVEPLQAYSYSASKAAIHQLTRQLASELASRNITVNTLVPGYFPTSMTGHLRSDDGKPKGILDGRIPLSRFGRPDDIAGAVIFLASRAGAYVTGAELVVDGGLSGCR